MAGTAVACIALWILATLRMRREFRASIRRLISVRDANLDELIVQRLGAEAVEEARRAFERGDEEEVLFALALFERYPEGCPDCDVVPLLDHDSAAVRERAVAVLRVLGAEEHVERVRELLEDPSLEVRAEAIYYLCAVEGEDAAALMRRYLEDADEQVRLAATACVLRHGEEEAAAEAEESVEALTRSARRAPNPSSRGWSSGWGSGRSGTRRRRV